MFFLYAESALPWVSSLGKEDLIEDGRKLKKMKVIKTLLLSSKTLTFKQLN